MSSKQCGNADRRVIMGGDRVTHLEADARPANWVTASGGSAAAIDLSTIIGLAAGTVLTDRVSFSHIIVTCDTEPAATPTLTIGYKLSTGGTGKSFVMYLDKRAGVQVIPLGMEFLAGADDITISWSGGAGINTIQLCGVK